MEKYGVVPPKFTKGWWAYFWDYYKVHTIVTVCSVALIGTTIVQCVNQPKYDLNMMYVNPSIIDEEMQNTFSVNISESIDEITDDNEKLAFVQSLPISSVEASDEQTYAMITKLSLELQTGETFLFVVNEEFANALSNSEGYEGCFMNIEDMGIDFNEQDVFIADNGNSYAIKLPENNLLNKSGINTQDLYIMIKKLYEREQKDDDMMKMYQNSIKTVEAIINS